VRGLKRSDQKSGKRKIGKAETNRGLSQEIWVSGRKHVFSDHPRPRSPPHPRKCPAVEDENENNDKEEGQELQYSGQLWRFAGRFSLYHFSLPVFPTSPRSADEVTRKVTEAQQKLAELKRAQEELERDRAALEETRRRQTEFTNGRTEMIQHLTRGLGLLEKAEFNARRDAEQMQQTIGEFRSALAQVESVKEENWTQDNFTTELTRGLTAIENARMEWNSARLKFPVLSGEAPRQATNTGQPEAAALPFAGRSLGELCKIGLALTWPLALVALMTLGLMVYLVVR
jgi:hypothetical protein